MFLLNKITVSPCLIIPGYPDPSNDGPMSPDGDGPFFPLSTTCDPDSYVFIPITGRYWNKPLCEALGDGYMYIRKPDTQSICSSQSLCDLVSGDIEGLKIYQYTC